MKYGIGAAAFCKMARAQVRIPGPGGAANSGGSGGSGGWSLVAHAAATVTGGGQDATISGINTSGANLIVIGVASGSATPGVQDSGSNTWTRLAVYGSSGSIALFYCYTPTVGSGHTFSTNQQNYPSIFAAAFAGSAASPFDQQNGNGSGAGTTIQPGSIAPGANNELIVSLLGMFASGQSVVSVGSSFTFTDSQPRGANNYGGSMAYLFQSTAAAVNPLWTVTGGSSSIEAAIASFK